MKSAPTSPAAEVPRVESYIRSDATFVLVCGGAFDVLLARLQASVAAQGLSLVHLHVFDGLVVAARGGRELRCRVCEVSDGAIAAELIAQDPALAHLLPWRLALHDRGDTVTITTPRPVALLSEYSPLASVARVARKLETRLQRVLLGMQT